MKALMTIPHWICLGGFASYCIFVLFHLIRIIKKTGSEDRAAAKGGFFSGFTYSLTGGMSPLKKETAYLHLPTYAAGILFHIASFVGFLWIVLSFTFIDPPALLKHISAFILFTGAANGLLIFFKRIIVRKVRAISVPDDYASNLIVTGFQLLSAAALLNPQWHGLLLIWTGFLFLYMQVGKLRHVLYFLIARLYLGIFYGKRGIWPPKRRKEWEKRSL